MLYQILYHVALQVSTLVNTKSASMHFSVFVVPKNPKNVFLCCVKEVAIGDSAHLY